MQSWHNVQWVSNSNGILVPAGNAGSSQSAQRNIPDWLQGVGSILSVILAAIALLIAWSTLADQQQINRSQAELNADQIELNLDEKDRADKIYAARMTYYLMQPDRAGEAFPGAYHALKIQNRAPIPFFYPELVGRIGSELVLVKLPTLPPCTAFAIPSFTLPGIDGVLDVEHMRFRDIHGNWSVDFMGTLRREQAPPLFEGEIVDLTYRGAGYERTIPRKWEDLADCGESG